MSLPIITTRADWAQNVLCLNGVPFSLADYPFYTDIYNSEADVLLLKTGRQVAKSTSISNFIITECCTRPFWKALFISPSQEQTQRFSNGRVGSTIFYSPEIRNRWVSKELSSRVFHREFTNGSEITFSFASDDPDRVRGVSADRVCYDEVQSIETDAVVPVINECLANSDYSRELYCGTPLTLENGIEQIWGWSTQTEWVMRCSACNKLQYFITEKCIGKKGPICLHCSAYIDVRNGHWVDMNVYGANHRGKKVKGYHISQFMLPKNVPVSMPSDEANQKLALKRWQRILAKYETYTPARFKNEVIGISDAIGTRLISQEELEALCKDYTVDEFPNATMLATDSRGVVAGVDWSGGGTQGTSRTVLWIWGITHGGQQHNFKLKTLYFKVYPETNPISGGVVTNIAEMCNRFNVSLVIGDAGEGALANSNLREMLGPHRAMQVQYRGAMNASASSRAFYWNKIDRFLADKTQMIDNYLLFVKREGVIFPSIKQMQIPIKDMLSVYEEVTKQGRKVWRHAASQPDDSLHAQVFGWMAAKFLTLDPLFTYNGEDRPI